MSKPPDGELINPPILESSRPSAAQKVGNFPEKSTNLIKHTYKKEDIM
jgi:hypothetical protein